MSEARTVMMITLFLGSIGVVGLLGGGQFAPIDGTSQTSPQTGTLEPGNETQTREGIFSSLNTITATYENLGSSNVIVQTLFITPILAGMGFIIALIVKDIIPF